MGKMKSFKEFSQDEQLVEQYTTDNLIFSNEYKGLGPAKRSKSKRLIGMRSVKKNSF